MCYYTIAYNKLDWIIQLNNTESFCIHWTLFNIYYNVIFITRSILKSVYFV